MGDSLRPPTELDFSNTQKAWPEYVKRFERYRIASGLSEKSGERQVSMLIYCMGREAETIATQITVRDPRAAIEADAGHGIVAVAAEDPEATLFDRTVEALNAYFNPRDNHLHYAVLFMSRSQQTDESNEHFIRNLHELVTRCSGWDRNHQDDMLRIRLLAGMRDKDLSRELQVNANITLEQIKQQLRTKEIIAQNQRAELDGEKQVLAVAEKQSTGTNKRGKDKKEQSTEWKKDCGYCGASHAKGRCPAYGKECKKCHKNGHFSRVCRQTDANKQINQLSMPDNASSDEGEQFHVHTVENVANKGSSLEGSINSNKWLLELTVNSKTIQARVDTGAEVSTISKQVFLGLGLTKVVKSKATLTGYGNQIIPVVGYAKLSVTVPSGKSGIVKFYVTDNDNQTLVGMPAIVELQLLPECSINQVSELSNQGSSWKSKRDLLAKYPKVFQGLGKFGSPVALELKATAAPRAVPPRLVPLKKRDKLKVELERFVASGIIEKDTTPAQWLSPLVLVNKPNGDLRLCLDPQYLNSQLVRAQCPIPTITEIFSRISGSKYYTTLDAKQGFHQIPLDEDSSKLTSFMTPYGKYRYLRLPMGICNAPELFHQRMLDAMADIKGVEVYIDDLLIHAPTLAEHDRILDVVMQRCTEIGLTLNPDKVELAKDSTSYLGHVLSGEGVKPCHSKVQAVQEMVVPDDKKAVQRFLGFVNFMAKFVPNLSEHTFPLREVSKKNTQFIWGEEQSKAFEDIKRLIAEAPTLAYYSSELDVTLTADSSAHSIGAVCLQDGRPVEFAAKSLTDCQQRYSQIEKELLATLFACKRFRYYCFGQQKIKVETDHLPLIGLMNKDVNQLSPRLAAMRLELLTYPIELEFRPGTEMVLADTLSRSCPKGTNLCDDLGTDPLLSVCNVVIRSDEVMAKYQLATAEDEELQVVMQYIQEGWPAQRKSCADRAKGFWNLRHDLSITNEVIFYGSRLVVPMSLRHEVVTSLHCAHQGVTKLLQRARESVFWPGLRKRLEEKCLACEVCVQAERKQTKEPLISFPVPEYPFQSVGVDLFHLQGKDYLLMVDYLSKWPVVRCLRDGTTSSAVIQVLREIFADFGLPEVIMSDNGPQFCSQEFKAFCRKHEMKHPTSSPLHPSGNGQVERWVATVKGMMRKCSEEGSDWLVGLQTIRNTPVGEGLPSPGELLQGRQLRDSHPVDTEKYCVRTQDLDKIKRKLMVRKDREKYFHDRHSRSEKPDLEPGQEVQVRPAIGPWRPAVVQRLVGERSYSVKTGNTMIRRNRKDIRHSKVGTKSNISPLSNTVQDSEVGKGRSENNTHSAAPENSTPPVASEEPVVNVPTSRSGRRLVKPKWHADYQL